MAEDWRTVRDVAGITGGSVEAALPDTEIRSVTIDSREAGPGSLFVALAGGVRDGHDFAEDAAAHGAVAILASRPIPKAKAPVIRVPDTLQALQRLAAARRAAFAGPVIAVTGSSGKTTTRQMIASILSVRRPTLTPVKNFNNHIGLPLTLCRLGPGFGAAVLELGTSGFGEIALLASLSRPDVGVVTLVGPAHLEQLGSLDGVAKAKGELLLALDGSGIAVVNGDDPRVRAMPTPAKRRVVFGRREDADARLLGWTVGDQGMRPRIAIAGEVIDPPMRLVGEHNAMNAAAAGAAAWSIGFAPDEIRLGLARVEPVAGRQVFLKGPGGALLIDDTYNANPSSVAAALDVLSAMDGAKVAVLGDMLELGKTAAEAHRLVGEKAAAVPLARLVTLGTLAVEIGRAAMASGLARPAWSHVEGHEEAAEALREWDRPGVAILFKGSRGMRMEKVIALLLGKGEG